MRVQRGLAVLLYIFGDLAAAQQVLSSLVDADLVGDRRLEAGSGSFDPGSGDAPSPLLPPPPSLSPSLPPPLPSSPAPSTPPCPSTPPPSPPCPSTPPPSPPPSPSTPPCPLTPPRAPPMAPPSPVSPVPNGQQVYTKPTVKVNLEAAGDVSEYGPTQKDAIKSAFVNATGVEQDRVSVDVRSGSVLIEVGVVLDTPAAATATSMLLSSTLSNVSSATSFLASAGVVVTSAPQVVQTTTLVVDDFSPPPPPSQPPQPPPPDSNDAWKMYAAAAGGVIALIFFVIFYCFCCRDPFNPFKGVHKNEFVGGQVKYTASTQSLEMEDMRGASSSVAVPILAVKTAMETRSPSRPSISYTPREHGAEL